MLAAMTVLGSGAPTRALLVAGSLVASLCAACGGTDAIEYEPDSKNVQRVRPGWEEPGATPPTPSVNGGPDAGSDAAADPGLDAAASADAGTEDAGAFADAGTEDASTADAGGEDAGADASGLPD